MSFPEEIRTRLTSLGAGTSTDVLIGPASAIPPTGAYTHLTETPGLTPERTQNAVTTPAYQRPSMQITIGAASWSLARARAKAAYDALVGVRNTTLSGTWYREVNLDQEPFDFPLDVAGRPRVIFNISAVKRPS